MLWLRLLRKMPPFVFFRAFLGLFFSYYITEMLIGRVMPVAMTANAMGHFVEIFLHGILEAEKP